MNLLELLQSLSAGQKGQDPGGAGSALVSEPPGTQTQMPAAPAPKTNDGGLDFMTRFMMGRAMVSGRAAGDPTGKWKDEGALQYLGQVLPLVQKQQADQAKVAAYGQGVTAVRDYIKNQDFDGADSAIAGLANTGMSEKAVSQLTGMVDKARGMSLIPVIMGSNLPEINKIVLITGIQAGTVSSKDAMTQITNALKDNRPQNVSTPGGGTATQDPSTGKILEQIVPGQTTIGNQLVETTPGKAPKAVYTAPEKMEKLQLDQDTVKRLATFGVSMDQIEEDRRSGDPQKVQLARALVMAAQVQSHTASSLKDMGLSSGISDIIASRPDRDQLLAWQATGTPEQKAHVANAITDARKQLAAEDVKKLASDAWARMGAQRAASAGDMAQVPGKEAYDQRTGKVTVITEAMLRNPANFAGGGGSIVLMPSSEAQQLRLQESEIVPSLPALKTISDKILSKAKLANIPTGAALDSQRWAGEADVLQFKEITRTLIIGLSRLESGSVRIPVTMLKMLEGVAPTTYATVEQAQRWYSTVAAQAENRKNGYLHLPAVPIPTTNDPTVDVRVKDGKIVTIVNPTAEKDSGTTAPTKLKSGKEFKMPGAR